MHVLRFQKICRKLNHEKSFTRNEKILRWKLENLDFEDRRKTLVDRREKSMTFMELIKNKGVRRYQRRSEDRTKSHYVDRYGYKSIVAFASVLILCCLDAYITLILISSGASELNPFLDVMIKVGQKWFFFIKYFITGICLFVLMIHKNFYVFKGKVNVKHIVSSVLIGYAILILYEVFLLFKIYKF